MRALIRALRAEVLKCRYASILWVTCIAFALAPIMGGVFMLIMRDPEALARAGPLNTKIQAMNFTADWGSYISILTQALGIGGILVFGFVASWVFGREYSDGTAKDLLALPISRVNIINAKFIVYTAWCIALAVSNALLGLLIGTMLQIPAPEGMSISAHCVQYGITTILTILLGTPIAFFAIWGKGYLAPLGFVVLAVVFAQIIAAAGYGYYFPWAIPGLFSGASGAYSAQISATSYLLLLLVSAAGYGTTALYWKHSDQLQ